MQGGLIRRLVPRFGEPRLIGAGIAIVALGFAGLALASGALELAGAIVLVGVGQGLVGPSVSGLLSRLTPASEQGAVFGTLSSAQTLARMISYSTANLLLGRVSTAAPYWFGFGVYLAAGLAAMRFLPRLSTSLEPQQSAGSVESVGAGGTRSESKARFPLVLPSPRLCFLPTPHWPGSDPGTRRSHEDRYNHSVSARGQRRRDR